MGKIVLNAIDIYKSYTNGANRLNVLDKFSLPVMEGEIITIMGQSGSGKSTALNILGTLDKPDSGVLEINGVNIDNLNDNDISS
jgi:ABC-type lipoprotein export system ATPase subunit